MVVSATLAAVTAAAQLPGREQPPWGGGAGHEYDRGEAGPVGDGTATAAVGRPWRNRQQRLDQCPQLVRHKIISEGCHRLDPDKPIPGSETTSKDGPRPARQAIPQPRQPRPVGPRPSCHYRAMSTSPEGSPRDTYGQHTSARDLGRSFSWLAAGLLGLPTMGDGGGFATAGDAALGQDVRDVDASVRALMHSVSAIWGLVRPRQPARGPRVRDR
jgi:hypothetical protein